MVDISAIAGLVSSLKAAGEITKAMVGLRDAAMFQSKVIELNEVILSAQASALESNLAQSSLLQRVGELEREIAGLKAWEAEKQRYQLTDHGGGTFTYVLKPAMAAGEPMHRVCPPCYQRGRKSILQSHGHNVLSQEMVECPECETKIDLGTAHMPPSMGARDDDYNPYF